jgi:hypothetical protein
MGDPSPTSGSRELPRRVIHIGVKGGLSLGDGGRKPVWGRIANAKSLGWAIYAVGFAIWGWQSSLPTQMTRSPNASLRANAVFMTMPP